MNETTTYTEQAREHLARAEGSIYPSTWSGSTLNYSDAFAALRDAQLGTGHALLAIGQQLAEISVRVHRVTDPRPDLMGITRAVRDMADALSATMQPTPPVDASTAVADIRDEVADVAAAVRELADAIRTQQQPRRRRWFSRTETGR